MSTHFATAYIKGIACQPRKTSVVASLVRNRTVADAIVILENTPRRAALPVRKAIESANANLLNSGVSIDPKTIRVNRLSVTAGTRFRRYVPASRGRALPFEKIKSNIFVEVCGEEKVRNNTANTANTAKSTSSKTDKKTDSASNKSAKKEDK